MNPVTSQSLNELFRNLSIYDDRVRVVVVVSAKRTSEVEQVAQRELSKLEREVAFGVQRGWIPSDLAQKRILPMIEDCRAKMCARKFNKVEDERKRLIPWPFSTLHIQDLTDPQVLEKVIGFLEQVKTLSTRCVTEGPSENVGLTAMNGLIQDSVDACIKELQSLSLSLPTPIGISAPVAEGKDISSWASLSQQTIIAEMIGFLAQICEDSCALNEKRDSTSPIKSLDLVLRTHLQKCIEELKEVLRQVKQVDQESPISPSSTLSLSSVLSVSCPCSAVGKSDGDYSALLSLASLSLYSHKKKLVSIPSDLFVNMQSALKQLTVSLEALRLMQEYISLVQSHSINSVSDTLHILAALVGELSEITSVFNVDIRDTPIPGLVKEYLHKLYSTLDADAQGDKDESQTITGMIRYGRFIIEHMKAFHVQYPSLQDLTAGISVKVYNSMGSLQSELDVRSISRTIGPCGEQKVFSFPYAVEESVLHLYVPEERPKNDVECLLEIQKMWTLIDGETAILCACPKGESTIAQTLDTVVRDYVKVCRAKVLEWQKKSW